MIQPTAAVTVFYGKRKKDDVPKGTCNTCKRWIAKQCQFYNRRTEGDYNKCWNHSLYNPKLSQKYVSPPLSMLREFIRQQERYEKQLYDTKTNRT